MSSATLTAPRGQTDLWSVDDDYQPFESLFAAQEPDEENEIAPASWIREEFDPLAEELAAASIAISSTRRLRSHPAYIGILGLGQEAVPYLLERLRSGEARPTWLSLLGSLTELPPAAGTNTIDDATSAWLRWEKHELTKV